MNKNKNKDLKYLSHQKPLSVGLYLKSNHENLLKSEYFVYIGDDVVQVFIEKKRNRI